MVLQQRLAQQSNEPSIPVALSPEQLLLLEMFISPSQATKTETIAPDQTRHTPQVRLQNNLQPVNQPVEVNPKPAAHPRIIRRDNR